MKNHLTFSIFPDSDEEDVVSEKTQQADGKGLKIGSSTTHGMCSDKYIYIYFFKCELTLKCYNLNIFIQNFKISLRNVSSHVFFNENLVLIILYFVHCMSF